MIDPSELVDNLVAMLRDIPDLVAEMGGDPERIYAYHDSVPEEGQPGARDPPDARAVDHGGLAGHAARLVRRHRRLEAPGHAVPAGAGDVRRRPAHRLLPAVPADHQGRAGRGRRRPMLNATVHPSCYPMDLPSIQRQTDAEGLDYFEVPLSFTEIGDD